MYVSMYVCTCVCIHIYIYTCIYIHTYTSRHNSKTTNNHNHHCIHNIQYNVTCANASRAERSRAAALPAPN